MPTLSSLATPAVVIKTTAGVASEDKVGIRTTLGFQGWDFFCSRPSNTLAASMLHVKSRYFGLWYIIMLQYRVKSITDVCTLLWIIIIRLTEISTLWRFVRHGQYFISREHKALNSWWLYDEVQILSRSSQDTWVSWQRHSLMLQRDNG